MTNPWRTGTPFNSYGCRNQLLPVLLLTVTALALADRTVAETSRSEANPVEFNIAAQSVPAALSEFARQARAQLFFISDGFEDIQANAVVGSYAAQQALDLLLEGTGLSANISADSGVKVRPVSATLNSFTLGSQLFATAEPLAPLTQLGAQYADDTRGTTVQQTGLAREKQGFKEPAKKLEEIVVTGSRIRGAESAAPVITVTAEDIDKGGFATVEQLISSWPQNFGGGASQENFTDTLSGQEVRQFTGSETSIDLRGLGSDATLILVNGRRIAAGGLLGDFTDISGIPIAAIERVEILTDGASAIYGSEAVGGVVNFVMLDNYEGAETRLQVSPDLGADTSDIRFGQVFGKSWRTGGLLLSYEYYEQDNLDASDRAQTANSDLTPFGGDDWSLPGGNPGTIRTGLSTDRVWYDIPAGQDGTSLTTADFVGLPSPQNLRNLRAGLDLRSEQERHSGYVKFQQELSEGADFFFETRFTKHESVARTVQDTFNLNVPDTNPFFVDPTGTGLMTVSFERYTFITDFGPAITTGDTETYGGTTGVLFDLGVSSWEAELSGSYARSEGSGLRSNATSTAAVATALAQTDPQLAFNPFGDGSHTNPGVLDALRVCCSGNDVVTDVVGFNADFNGQLFELASGPVGVAAGLEYREESLKGRTIDDGSVVAGIDRGREISAVYAELFVPLVSPKTGRPGMERLELSIAGRYSDYSDFGDNVSPKVGVVWSPSQSLLFRGTYGESFKAPLLSDLDTADPLTNSASYIDLSFAGPPVVPALFRFGGNEKLTPEEAATWTAGIQFAPTSVEGLNIDLTYFDIVFEDRILAVSTSLLDVFDPEFAPLVNLTPTQAEIIEIVGSPAYDNSTPPVDIINGTVPVDAIVDYRRQNFSKWEVSGLDLQLVYSFDSNAGRFDLGLNGSYLFKVNQALLVTLPSLDLVSTVRNPVDFRARGSLSWTKGHWGMSGFLNYTDSYIDDESDPARSIDSWKTVDFQLTYDTEQRDPSRWLDGLQFALSIRNLFDEDPPFVNRSGGLGFDPANSSAFGQAISLQAVKTWN
ncbi:MAG: TonB-dependent receptor [Woeseia sp.]